MAKAKTETPAKKARKGGIKPDTIDKRKRQLLEALRESLGIVTMACESAGVSRQTFYDWKRTDPDFAAECDDIHNRALDFVESKLFGNIENGDVASIIFYLKTKGKSRGYVERQEVEAQVETKFKRINLLVQPDEDESESEK